MLKLLLYFFYKISCNLRHQFAEHVLGSWRSPPICLSLLRSHRSLDVALSFWLQTGAKHWYYLSMKAVAGALGQRAFQGAARERGGTETERCSWVHLVGNRLNYLENGETPFQMSPSSMGKAACEACGGTRTGSRMPFNIPPSEHPSSLQEAAGFPPSPPFLLRLKETFPFLNLWCWGVLQKATLSQGFAAPRQNQTCLALRAAAGASCPHSWSRSSTCWCCSHPEAVPSLE